MGGGLWRDGHGLLGTVAHGMPRAAQLGVLAGLPWQSNSSFAPTLPSAPNPPPLPTIVMFYALVRWCLHQTTLVVMMGAVGLGPVVCGGRTEACSAGGAGSWRGRPVARGGGHAG